MRPTETGAFWYCSYPSCYTIAARETCFFFRGVALRILSFHPLPPPRTSQHLSEEYKHFISSSSPSLWVFSPAEDPTTQYSLVNTPRTPHNQPTHLESPSSPHPTPLPPLCHNTSRSIHPSSPPIPPTSDQCSSSAGSTAASTASTATGPVTTAIIRASRENAESARADTRCINVTSAGGTGTNLDGAGISRSHRRL
jgi:hypothetical protein